MNCGVYEISNSINGNRYIGSSINIKKRWHDHKVSLDANKHRNAHLQRAWNKYKEASFSFQMLLICAPNNTIYFEDLCLKNLKPEYNICPNAHSSLGVKRTDEFKRKVGKASKGRKMSEENKKELSKRMMGNKFALGRTRGGWEKGKEFSKEHKHNLSLAGLGRKMSKESIEKRTKTRLRNNNGFYMKRKEV